MRAKFSRSFKIQAVEKALNRSEGITLSEIADLLQVSLSSLNKWIVQARNQEFETVEVESMNQIKEKRPQDWRAEDRLQILISCGSLDEEAISALCREQGIYPHHLKQWKSDFTVSNQSNNKVKNNSEMRHLKQEIKGLKRELNRKDKALAETAALLVLQKKVHAIWGSDEDNSL